MGAEQRKNGCGEEKLYFGATVIINQIVIHVHKFI